MKQAVTNKLKEVWIDWTLLFIVLITAIYLIIQSPYAPQLFLLVTLYIITVNFSIPLSWGYIGLTPIVAISTLLTVDYRSGLFATGIGLLLAEVMRPLWNPLWYGVWDKRYTLLQRFISILIHWGTFALIGATNLSGDRPTIWQQLLAKLPNTNESTFLPLFITLAYLTLFLLTLIVAWALSRANWQKLFNEAAPSLITSVLFAIPLTLFIVSADVGLPAFVLLCASTASFSIISWVSWQRRYVMSQRLEQFALFNQLSLSLRESLEPTILISRLYELLHQLIPTANKMSLTLQSAEMNWLRWDSDNQFQQPHTVDQLDKLTDWVVTHQRILDLDSSNWHYLQEHQLPPPTATPSAWLGIPLTTGESRIGVLIVQKSADPEPFTAWIREIATAISSQASIAIQNARLHAETVRLYNLTDAALAQRVEQLQALLYAILEGVLMIDTEGRILLINPTAARFLGKSADELRETSLDIALATRLGYTRPQLLRLLRELKERESIPKAVSAEFALTHQNNTTIWKRDEIAVTADHHQTLIGWLILFRDITEERARAEWRADLTRMIVHDLRNPITTISSAVNLLDSQLPPHSPHSLYDFIATAQHGCLNLLEMVDSLMDINRAEAGKFIIDAEALRLTNLVERIVAFITPLATQRHVVVTWESADNLPAVWADEEVVRRIFINLLDNALKFSPRDGRVHIALQEEPSPNPQSAENGVRILIQDDGPGIPPDQRQRIFERFITFNPGGGQIRGTGLGLTFCKLAVEAHGGQIGVKPAPQHGSLFYFTLPGIPLF